MKPNYRWTVILENSAGRTFTWKGSHPVASSAVAMARHALQRQGLDRSRFVLIGLQRHEGKNKRQLSEVAK